MKSYIILLLLIINILTTNGLFRKRQIRNTGGAGARSVSVPLLGPTIDLEIIDGVEQVTKLVLMKTDSLPGESTEKIDGRYLNSLMETLYTGLRKPFKSVSADILGIFPSFEEIQIRCDRSSTDASLEKDESISIRRRSLNETKSDRREKDELSPSNHEKVLKVDDKRNETISNEDATYMISYKSSFQVCRAVTSDCLSMDSLAQVLPPSITTFDSALVRLCPVMLFRIMNDICHKTNNPLNGGYQDELMSAYKTDKVKEENNGAGQVESKESISLNTLLREKQMLKSLQSSDELIGKRPQKLHKKLKTQTPYKTTGRLNSGGLQQHGSVDEQLLKIRLKLTEPSIEKVWIFSLLFVILSIVVSMGGLIVLPFVKKTTRRRILTLFEGLAVGGLAGSATLHMFPQAFGLVDENYHKYFWRIFVVFFGIYICYLCERMLKILKVVKARMKRRSRASLTDMNFRYGFNSVSREVSKNRSSRSSRRTDPHLEGNSNILSSLGRKKNMDRKRSYSDTCKECCENQTTEKRNKKIFLKKGGSVRKEDSKRKGSCESLHLTKKDKIRSDCKKCSNDIDIESISIDQDHSNTTRSRLVHYLKSVQSQFSPVYAVQTQSDGLSLPKDEPRAGRLMRLTSYNEGGRKLKKLERLGVDARSRAILRMCGKDNKSRQEKFTKQRDMESKLYHQRLMSGYGRENDLNQRYLQQRLSSVNDLAAERQDQDNAARMSVDTVAWMIVFGDAVLNVIDGLSIGAAFERNILAGISISVAVMLEEVTHRLGTFAVLIRAGLIIGILLSDATEDATPYIFCAAGGIFLYMALVDVMKEMNRSIENAIRKDIKSTLQIFALQNVGIILAVIFLSFLALYEQAMDFEEYQIQYNQPS